MRKQLSSLIQLQAMTPHKQAQSDEALSALWAEGDTQMCPG